MTHFLIVKKRALGDSIMGLSSVRYLKSIHPDWKITYAVPRWIYPLYQEVQTAADAIIPIDGLAAYLFKIFQLRPDIIHEMHQSGGTRKIHTLYATFKRISYTFHNHHQQKAGKIKDQGKPIAAIQRDLNGVHAFWGENSTPNYLAHPPQIKILNPKKIKRVIIGAVATRQTKMWPLSFVRELATSLQAQNIEVAIPIGPTDHTIKNQLADLPLIQIPLPQLPRFFSEAALYIGNDTGIKHLAVAVGIPTLTFFGPENPSEWHPYDQNRHPYFFQEKLECRTRTAHYCALSTCDSMICLNQFSAKAVEQKILSMLA